MKQRFTYATRRSALALAQSRGFIAVLRGLHPKLEFSEEQVTTSGDRIQDRALSDIGGKGLFVREIEDALFAERADFAVHSIKDVPGQLPEGLVIGCIPARGDPRDALVSTQFASLHDLPEAAIVGTSSLRRRVALLRHRPDLRVVPLRGNVDTRLRKLDARECDGIVLAYAGLHRLGLEGRVTEVFDRATMMPAVGQGALGIEMRKGDTDVEELLASVHHLETARCVAAERGVMIALSGDCRTPLGAHARRIASDAGELLEIDAFVADPDGENFRSGSRIERWDVASSEAQAESMGRALGMSLLP